MSSLDLSKLSGPDAIVALRSYPRRFREVLAAVPDEPDVDELAQRLGPDGRSALDVVHGVAALLTLLRRNLSDVLVHDDPVLHPAVLDAGGRDWELPPGTTVASALDDLTGETEALAAEAERIHGPDWNRTGQVAGGGTTTAIDLVREGVRAGSDGLKATEAAMAAARR